MSGEEEGVQGLLGGRHHDGASGTASGTSLRDSLAAGQEESQSELARQVHRGNVQHNGGAVRSYIHCAGVALRDLPEGNGRDSEARSRPRSQLLRRAYIVREVRSISSV